MLDSVRMLAFGVADPPDTWPSLWREGTPAEWLDWSRERIAEWDDPRGVIIPVWGTPPNGTPASPRLITVPVDWSDDRYVIFHAPSEGFYYLTVSYHPNWVATHDHGGPWRGGPNQMVAYVPEAGEARLVFERSGWEAAGLWIALATLTVAIGWRASQRASDRPRRASRYDHGWPSL